jgi:CheY-like chemotaxis protein
VEMPKMTGLELLKSLDEKPLIINGGHRPQKTNPFSGRRTRRVAFIAALPG